MEKFFSILSIIWGVVTLLPYLRSKARKLQGKTQNLQDLKEDLTQRAETLISKDQTKSKQMSRQLQIWFIQVKDLVQSSQMVQEKSEERQRSFTWWGCGCCLNYKLANEAVELLRRVEQTIKRGDGFSDDELVGDVLDLKVKFIPMYFDVVGQEDELETALQLIIDDDDDSSVEVVGICGTAGVGKTTLLKRINNYFCGEENASIFDFVIFLRVGGDGSNLCTQKIQKDIGQSLGLFSLSENGDEIYQAKQIFKSLQFKNFLLLLDDVWEKIDLVRVGIPPLNSCVDKKQKVVITTRYESVAYSYPRGRVVQMGLLSREESWELFRKHVNDEELLKGNEEIHTLAREMADQCGGLPSQLSSVGKSMAAAKMDYQWRNAKRKRIWKTCARENMKGIMEERVCNSLELFEQCGREMEPNNQVTSSFQTGLCPKPAYTSKHRHVSNVDEDGILNVSATDLDSGKGGTMTIKGVTASEAISKMIAEGERYKLEDDGQRRIGEAKANLRRFAYTTRNAIREPNNASKLSRVEMYVIEEACAETIKWLEKNDSTTNEHECEERKKELDELWEEVRVKHHI